jgi:hypothetical protein
LPDTNRTDHAMLEAMRLDLLEGEDPDLAEALLMPSPRTRPTSGYFTQLEYMFSLEIFVAGMATGIDELVAFLGRRLGVRGDVPDRDELEPERVAKLFPFFRATLHEMMFARMVDNYLIFLSDTLTELFTAQPAMLRSSKPVPVEDVLDHPTMEEFIAAYAEGKVRELSHKSLPELSRYFERHKLPLAPSDADLEALADLVLKRNLIVHNRGVVDTHYKRAVSSSSLAPGDTLGLEHIDPREAGKVLSRSVRAINEGVLGKFPRLQDPESAEEN